MIQGPLRWPSPVAHAGKPTLRSFLDYEHASDIDGLPPKMNEYICELGRHLANIVGGLPDERKIVCFDASRRPRIPGAMRVEGSSWGATIRTDIAPTFTTGNYQLWLMAQGVPEVPGFGRRLTLAERARLSGVVPESLASLSNSQAVRALGNMMPVDVVGIVLKTVLDRVAVLESALSAMPTNQAGGTGTTQNRKRKRNR